MYSGISFSGVVGEQAPASQEGVGRAVACHFDKGHGCPFAERNNMLPSLAIDFKKKPSV